MKILLNGYWKGHIAFLICHIRQKFLIDKTLEAWLRSGTSGFPKDTVRAESNFCAFGKTQKARNENHFNLKNQVLAMDLETQKPISNAIVFTGLRTSRPSYLIIF